jgi:hypothetical protein
MDNQQITEVTGFGSSPTGGYFECAPGQTPAAMRVDGDFIVSALFRMSSQLPDSNERFVAGVRGGGAGWSISYDPTLTLINARVGPVTLSCVPALSAEDHVLVTLVHVDGVGAFLYVNGEAQDFSAVVYVPELVAELSFGNIASSPDDTLRDGGLVAVGFSDVAPSPASFDVYAELWAETERANDLIDQQQLFQYLWSARQGMPNVVDGGNESWVDSRSGVALGRVGAQLGMSAAARDAEWSRLSVFP